MILLWNLKQQARCRKLRLLATACEDLWRGTLSQWATARSEIQKCPAKPDQALELYFWIHLSSCILYSWMHMSYNTYTDLAGHLQVERGGPGWKSKIFAMTCRCYIKHLKQDRSRVEKGGIDMNCWYFAAQVFQTCILNCLVFGLFAHWLRAWFVVTLRQLPSERVKVWAEFVMRLVVENVQQQDSNMYKHAELQRICHSYLSMIYLLYCHTYNV